MDVIILGVFLVEWLLHSRWIICFPGLDGRGLESSHNSLCVSCLLSTCRELREKIQPEIMELIKQQRLNRLCEGTCFRKISSRRRQGEAFRARMQCKRSYNIQTQAWICMSNPTDLCCGHSVSPPSVLDLHPSSLHHFIPSAAWKPHGIFEALDCCRAAVIMVHTNFSGSVGLRGSNGTHLWH